MLEKTVLWIVSIPFEQMGQFLKDFKLLIREEDQIVLQGNAILSVTQSIDHLEKIIAPKQIWVARETLLARGLSENLITEINITTEKKILKMIDSSQHVWPVQ